MSLKEEIERLKNYSEALEKTLEKNQKGFWHRTLAFYKGNELTVREKMFEMNITDRTRIRIEIERINRFVEGLSYAESLINE